MELNTIAECDVALHCLDMLLGEHRREYDEATKQSHEITQKAHLAWNQLNITNDRIREIEQRKIELCITRVMESKSNSVNSSQSNGASVAEGVYEVFDVITNAEVAKTLND